MKSKKVVTILIAVLVLGFCTVGGIMLQKKFNSSAAIVDGKDEILIPEQDKNYPEGSDKNPFVILEIVPYEGFAEIGYLIAGQEPIDIEAFSWSEYAGNIESTKAFTVTPEYVETFSPKDGMLKAKKYTTREELQYGYYEKKSEYKYGYNQVITKVDGSVTKVEYVPSENKTGNYEWVGLKYGQRHNQPTDHNAERVYTTKVSTLYSCYHVDYTNKNIFLKQCLNLTDEQIPDYNIQVITISSAMLNKNLGLIDSANLIYITDKNHSGTVYMEAWKDDRFRRLDLFNENCEKLSSTNDYKEVRFYSKDRDLSWEAVVKILQKKSGCDLPENVSACPVIYDVNALTSELPWKRVDITKRTNDNQPIIVYQVPACDNNVYKLGLLMRQMETFKIYDMYLNKGIIVTRPRGDGMTTGYFTGVTGDAQRYWAAATLIPYQLVKYNYNYDIMKNTLREMGYPRFDDFGDNTFAGDGLYIYNADCSLGQTFETGKIYLTDQTKEAFQYYKQTEGSLTPAQIVRYLLDRANDGANIHDLSILEIQPFEDYKQDWRNYIVGLLPSFRGELNITTMTSKEFICHIEELVGTYDMVYIGMNKSKAQSYQTVDLALDTLAYSHIGKSIQVNNSNKMAGWIRGLNANFSTRYSGNDITKLKMNELVQYIQAGYPIMLATDMLKGSTVSKQIDISSNLYELIQTVSTPGLQDRLLSENIVSGYTLNQVLKKASCDVTFHDLPQEYQDAMVIKNPDGTELSASQIYINGGAENKKVLSYRFVITDDGTDSIYSATLYLDQNADGLFSKEKEELQDVSIKEVVTNATVSSDQLQAGCEYVLERGVSDYSGVITWQICIEKSTKVAGVYLNTGLKKIQTGVSAIQNKTKTKEIIKVLQIASDNDPSIYLPTTKNIQDSGALGIQDYSTMKEAFKNHVFYKDGTPVNVNQAITTGLFYYYLKNLQDYEVVIDRCFVSEYNSKMNQIVPGINLNEYQMLILGFADVYSDVSSDKGRDAIKDFIDLGKTVLFTHDTAMYYSNYNLSVQFRNMFGMDRFGTTQMKTTIPTVASLAALKYDLAYFPNQTNESKDIRLSESYGFTNQHIKRYAVTGTSGSYFDQNLITENVTNINKGQITKYPYVIPDQLSVVKTHSQYFQLNMEDPSIVVWYSLANNDSYPAYDKNDGRNGYYIYNKGNITYSGAGHIINNDITVMPDNEVKLFVNTIIAAYRATPTTVKVVVTNEDKSTNESVHTDYLLVDYDSENKELALGNGSVEDTQTKSIYFKLDDQSLYKDSKFNIEYYLKEYDPVTDKKDKEVRLAVDTYDKDGQKVTDSNPMKANTDFSYYFNVNLEPLDLETTMDIVIKLTLTYAKDDGSEMKLESYRNVQLIRRGLFNLD